MAIPIDIIHDLPKMKTRRRSLNILWAALGDAISLMEMDISSERRPNRKFHDAEYRVRMKQLRQSLNFYKQERRRVIKKGNLENWR